MGKTSKNSIKSEDQNIEIIVKSIIEAFKKNQLIIADGVVIDTNHNITIDLTSGNWLDDSDVKEKANRVRCKKIKLDEITVEVSDYTYITITRALINNDTETINKLKNGFVINHKNGDVQDNRENNIEIIGNEDKGLHEATLHHLYIYFSDFVWMFEYKKGSKMIPQYILNNKDACISVDMIKSFNQQVSENPTCKVYRMTPINDSKNRQKEYKNVPNQDTIKYFICWLRNNYDVDVAPGLKLTDVVERLRKEKEEDAYWKSKMTS